MRVVEDGVRNRGADRSVYGGRDSSSGSASARDPRATPTTPPVTRRTLRPYDRLSLGPKRYCRCRSQRFSDVIRPALFVKTRGANPFHAFSPVSDALRSRPSKQEQRLCARADVALRTGEQRIQHRALAKRCVCPFATSGRTGAGKVVVVACPRCKRAALRAHAARDRWLSSRHSPSTARRCGARLASVNGLSSGRCPTTCAETGAATVRTSAAKRAR